jgi:hypothetical protein
MVTLQMTIKGIMEYCVDSYANNVAVWCCKFFIHKVTYSIDMISVFL